MAVKHVAGPPTWIMWAEICSFLFSPPFKKDEKFALLQLMGAKSSSG